MRSLKSGLIAIALSGLFGTLAVIGCSASGGGDGLGNDGTPTDPTVDSSTGSALPPQMPIDYGDASTGGLDASKHDAAKPPVDAGPPPPVEGTVCTKPNTTASKSCGKCGKEETLCLTADDGGTATWGPYGACMGELTTGCIPGATQACGNCGTQTCGQYCAWGACTGQPPMSCPAGSVDYSAASCTAPNTYHSRTCSATCTWGNYSATCGQATTPNKMTISSTVNGVVSATWTVAGDTLRPDLDSCPGATVAAGSDDGAFAVVEVDNPTAKVATLTVYQSKSPTGTANLDMVMWTYDGAGLPLNNAGLSACTHGTEDYCLGAGQDVATNPCGNTGSNYYFAGIASITVPAGGSILVYNSLFGSFVAGGDNTFNLNLKTTKLQ